MSEEEVRRYKRDYRKNLYCNLQEKLLAKLSEYENLRNEEYNKYGSEVNQAIAFNFIPILFFIIGITIVKTAIIEYITSLDSEYLIMLAVGVVLSCITSFKLFKAYSLLKTAYRNYCKIVEYRIKSEILNDLIQDLGTIKWARFEPVHVRSIYDSKYFKKDIIVEKEDDDCFVGSYKGVNIRINETILRFAKKPTKKCILVELEFNKNFNGNTIVRPISETKNIGFKPIYEKVVLEDVNFNEKFFVESNDQVEARYILTTSLIDRIKAISFCFRVSNIGISFNNNKMLLLLFTRKNICKLVDLRTSVYKMKGFNTLIDEIISILDIVDELKLNQNIGL